MCGLKPKKLVLNPIVVEGDRIKIIKFYDLGGRIMSELTDVECIVRNVRNNVIIVINNDVPSNDIYCILRNKDRYIKI